MTRTGKRLVLAGLVASVLMAAGYAQYAAVSRAAKPQATAAAAGGEEPNSRKQAPASPTERAIERARKDGKYSFILFYRPGEQADDRMRASVSRVQARLSGKAVFLSVDVNSAAESSLVARYGAGQAPLPVTLVMAPNGAIVNAFSRTADEAALAGAFVSAKVAEVSKSLQDGKLVALCLQGAATKHNKQSRQAVQEFVADTALGGQAVLVLADPSVEKELLRHCGMQGPPAESTVVLLVPPGQLIASVAGATTKDILIAKLQAGLAACGSSCSPSGCGQ